MLASRAVQAVLLVMLLAADGGTAGAAQAARPALYSLDAGAPDAGAQPPKGLACLARYYLGTPVRSDAGWGL
ncbi:MAG: hypothetical protein JNK82_31350, partial [Myxococcaceae bacterium]|nr:hypothetical protein [Myxococcaceae bacterium]